MSIKSLMEYTFVSKYARWDEEKYRRETWSESVDRVRQMMLDQYVPDGSSPEIVKAVNQAYDDMKKKKILGSQRALQFGGSPVFKHNARIDNCIASYIDQASISLSNSAKELSSNSPIIEMIFFP